MQISVPPLPTSTTAQPLIDITGHNISDCVQLLLEPQNASYSFLFPYVVVLRRQGLRHLYCKHLNVGNWWSYCCETWPYLKRPFLQQYVIFWLTSWVVVPLEVIMPLPFDWVHLLIYVNEFHLFSVCFGVAVSLWQMITSRRVKTARADKVSTYCCV